MGMMRVDVGEIRVNVELEVELEVGQDHEGGIGGEVK